MDQKNNIILRWLIFRDQIFSDAISVICLTKFVLNSIMLFISKPVVDIKHFAKL